ncbi:MAG: hypothetical protein ABSG41_24700 [Bryobacteraceae bacterium]
MSLPWKGSANLTASTCQQYLRAGCITEIVKLDGDAADLTAATILRISVPYGEPGFAYYGDQFEKLMDGKDVP